MKDKILIIIPTKNRLNDFILFVESWAKTTKGNSDIIVGIDRGDKTYESIYGKYDINFEEVSPMPPLKIVNYLANKYSNGYKYVCFMEDDCVFVSDNWENTVINKLNELGSCGIVWCNDLLIGSRIVGLPFMDSEIVRVLGYMLPPDLNYLYADNFWKDLCVAIGSYHYFEEIVIEHRHYSTNKREKDEISNVVDSNLDNDGIIYNIYKATSFYEDIIKLRKILV